MIRARAVLTVLLALMVVAAVPASVSATETDTVTYGEHTTDTDFGNGTLTNMSVQGTGTSASVVAERGSSSETVINATATDNDSYSYQVDNDAAQAPEVTLTGDTATEWDNVSASGVGDGGTVTIDVAGNRDPAGPSTNEEPVVELAGQVDRDVAFRSTGGTLDYVDAGGDTVSTGADTYRAGGVGDFDDDSTLELAYTDASSNLEISDPSGSTTDTNQQADRIGYMGDINGDGDVDLAYVDTNNNLKYVDAAGNDVDLGVDASTVGGIGDIDGDADPEVAYEDTSNNLKYVDEAGNVGDPVAVATRVGGIGDIDGDGDLDIAYNDNNDNLKYVDEAGNVVDTGETSANTGGVADVDGDGSQEILFADGNENIKYVAASGTAADTGADGYAVGQVADIGSDTTSDPAVDIDGDGTDEISHSGVLGGSQSYNLPNLSTADDSWNVSVGTGSVDITAAIEERSQTTDPKIEINGNWLNKSGVLSDGNSTTLTGQESWVGVGGNSVNVSVGDGSLSADAPTPQVGLRIEQPSQSYAVPAEYVSDAYQIDRATEGTIDLTTVDSGTVTVTWQGADGQGGWTDIATASYTSAGTKTQSLGSYQGSQVRVRVDFASSQSDPKLVVDRDSVAFTNHHPDVRNATAGPTGTVRYESPTLSVDVGDQEFSTTQGDNVSVEFYVDGSPVGTTSLTSNGTASLSPPALSDGSHNWYAVATDDYGGQTTSQTFSITVDHAAPTVTNLQPSGNLSTDPSDITVDVTDADFPRDGDSVDVTVTLDGQTVATKTASSNGTISVSMPNRGATAGSHNLSVVASDDYGATVSLSGTFGVPDELLIYNESAPNTLVKSPTETTVTFYASNGSVYTRSTTNGTIDFAGLPADQAFIVEADAQDYISRRIYIESLIEQQRIYLLPENATTASVVFTLRDDSGQFTPVDETLLYIEKPLNISGQTKYQVITSDQFSATREVPTTLENDQRYRLRIKGPDGNTRVLGAYRTAGADTATLNVGRVQFDSGAEADSPVFQSSMTTINGQQTIRIKYLDPANATDGLTLKVVNESSGNVLRPQTTESGPFGEYVETIPVSGSAEGHTYNVTYQASRTGYEDVSGQQYAGELPGILGNLGLDASILSMLGYLTILGVLGLTAISYPRYAGIPTTAVAAALVTLGAVSIPPLLVGGAGVISLMFAVGGEGVRS